MKTTYKCDHCGKEFKTENACREHEMTCGFDEIPLDQRVAYLERDMEMLKTELTLLRQVPVVAPSSPWPRSPYDAPATCGLDSGPRGPENPVNGNRCEIELHTDGKFKDVCKEDSMEFEDERESNDRG